MEMIGLCIRSWSPSQGRGKRATQRVHLHREARLVLRRWPPLATHPTCTYPVFLSLTNTWRYMLFFCVQVLERWKDADVTQ